MNETIFKILAVLGALAWLSPFIVQWIIKKITKPNFTIFSHKELEIGYSTFGPILNINFAFLVKDKDALIEKISLSLQHEDRETHDFYWEWFEEQLLQMDIPNYGSMPFKKNQKAIAINALTDTLVDKKIGFQNPEFHKRYNELFLATNETYDNIINSGQDPSTIAGKNEYNKLQDHFKNSFFWKLGNYNADIEVFISNQTKPYKHQIIFKLTNMDKKNLEINIKNCKDIIKNHYIETDNEFKVDWQWVFPIKMEE